MDSAQPMEGSSFAGQFLVSWPFSQNASSCKIVYNLYRLHKSTLNVQLEQNIKSCEFVMADIFGSRLVRTVRTSIPETADTSSKCVKSRPLFSNF